MKWLLRSVFVLLLFVHGSALAQSESAEQTVSDPATTADQGAADYGILIDDTGIQFISTGALVISAVPGAGAANGPAAGPVHRQPRPDATYPPPEEAVP